jgi:2-polyprenyl-3-methyl-5-hydroxy-6-metoxy-1,4-benzoquinol methylase
MSVTSAPARSNGKSEEALERLSDVREVLRFPDHLARYRFAIQWAPGARVLDLCCGIGYGSRILATGGAERVLGLDISPAAVAAAKSGPSLPNLEYGIADACKPLEMPGAWDLVTCFEGIEHVPDPAALVKNVYAALAPGGVAVISTPNADAFQGGHSGNPYHVSEMSEQAFRALLGQYDWAAEWYAQVDPGDFWTRPRWQQALIRLLPAALRKMRPKPDRSGGSRRPAPQGASVTDHSYPMPWQQALSLIYEPPPDIIVAVCRKPSAPRGQGT